MSGNVSTCVLSVCPPRARGPGVSSLAAYRLSFPGAVQPVIYGALPRRGFFLHPRQACRSQIARTGDGSATWRPGAAWEASGAPTGPFDGHPPQDGTRESLIRTTQASEATIAEMAECLVELADREVDLKEELEILARGVGR